MLLFKRIITTVVAFLLLSVVLWTGTIFAGDLIASVSARIGYRTEHHGAAVDRLQEYAVARKATSFGRLYAVPIAWGALALSAIAAPALSFGGAFVWCRKNPGPPFLR